MTPLGKILIVDDHLDLAENIAEILTLSGYDTVVCESAEIALARLHKGDIAALITDYKLPGWTGAELIGKARTEGLGMPAVVISAYTDEGTIRISRAAGASSVLAKPVNVPQLLSVVEAFGHEPPERPGR